MPNPSSPSGRPAESRPGPSTPSDDAQRREALLILINRAMRGVLLPDELVLLRQLVDAEVAASDKARADAEQRVADLEQSNRRWYSNAFEQRARAEQAEAERDGAYRERAQLVAHLAALHPSHIGHTDPNAPDWAVVIVETPAGQMSWHIAERDMDLFEHVQPTNRICRGWDGHTTEEKYERLRQLIAEVCEANDPQAAVAQRRAAGYTAQMEAMDRAEHADLNRHHMRPVDGEAPADDTQQQNRGDCCDCPHEMET